MLVFLCISLLLVAGQAFAASIYISPTGNDTTGNGSLANPYRTLTKASTVAVAGDTVYARGGTYTATFDTIGCSGTAGNPITFTEYPGEQAIFTGTGRTYSSGEAMLLVVGNYVIVDGYEVTYAPPTSTKVDAICVWEVSNVTIRNCIAHEIGGAGLNGHGHNVTFEGNEVYRAVLHNENNAMGGGGWSCGVKMQKGDSGDASTNITFRNNYVHEVWGEAIDAIHTNGVTIEDNTVGNGFSVSIYLDNTQNAIVRNNVCYTTPENEHRKTDGDLPDGILMASERYTGWTEVDVTNVQIYNNLIYRCAYGIAFWHSVKSYNNLKIYHNTVVGPEKHGFWIDSGTSSGNELKNNIIYGTYLNANPSAWVTSYNCWPSGVPAGSHPNSFAADPQFVNPVQSDIPNGFKLGSGSPCINTGTSVGVSADYFGTARDSNPDIGFHEYAATSPPVANFSGNPTNGNVPLTVMFTDLSTNSPTSWSWTFGDSGTSTAQSPSHQYTTANQYTVSLQACNAQGCDSETKNNYITVTTGQPPVANFTGVPTSGYAPLTVNFTDTSTNTPTSWSWNFGDSGTSTAQNPSHQYTTANTYTVSLTATNAYGSDDEVKTNYITATTPSGGDFFCDSMTIVQGTLYSGSHTNTHTSDDSYLVVASVKAAQNKYWIEEDYSFSTGLSGLSSLSYSLEGHHDNANTITCTVKAYNYSTSAWVSVGSWAIPTGSSDSTYANTISNLSQYISGGVVQLKLVASKGQAWQLSMDLVKITAQP